jgi:hypothetical protein
VDRAVSDHSLVSNRLLGVRTKLERAQEHFENLDREVADFITSQPFRVKEERSPGSHEAVGRAVVKQQPPVRWGAIVGDIVHNLRASLEYLAWQLVEVNGGVPDDNTGFPISTTRKHFEKRGVVKLRGAHPDAIQAVGELQPFLKERPQQHALSVLHRFDIRDKHHLLHVVRGTVAGAELELQGTIILHEAWTLVPDRGLEDGDVIFQLRADAGTKGGNVKSRVTFDFCLNDPSTQLRPTLHGLTVETQKIVDTLARFL